MEGARLNRIRHVGARQLHLQHERNLHRRRVADRLGKDADLVMEIRGGADAAVEPGGIRRARAHHRTRLAFGGESRMNRGTDRVDAEHHERIEVVVERIAERRREEHRARRSRLMMVVHDRGIPLAIHHPVRVGALRHVHHVEIAVVVVADVFLVQARDAVRRSLLLVALAHVPVGDELHAVRIDERTENDVVVQNPLRLGIGFRIQPIDRLDQLLRAEHFRRVQPAVNPHDSLAVLRELARLVVGDPVGQRELAVHLLVLRQLPVILGRGDDGRQLRTSFFGLPDLDDRHPVGFLVQLLEVLDVLRVVDQEVVVADVVSELFLRGRQLGRFGLRLRSNNRDRDGERDERDEFFEHARMVAHEGAGG